MVVEIQGERSLVIPGDPLEPVKGEVHILPGQGRYILGQIQPAPVEIELGTPGKSATGEEPPGTQIQDSAVHRESLVGPVDVRDLVEAPLEAPRGVAEIKALRGDRPPVHHHIGAEPSIPDHGLRSLIELGGQVQRTPLHEKPVLIRILAQALSDHKPVPNGDLGSLIYPEPGIFRGICCPQTERADIHGCSLANHSQTAVRVPPDAQ